MHRIKTFLVNNYKTILKIGFAFFLLYWIIFILTPKNQMTTDQKNALDSLSNKIIILHEDNKKLEGDIKEYNQKIIEIDNNIGKIKSQKTIIKEYYHEKISGVDKLTVRELDSFFTDRYKY